MDEGWPPGRIPQTEPSPASARPGAGGRGGERPAQPPRSRPGPGAPPAGPGLTVRCTPHPGLPSHGPRGRGGVPPLNKPYVTRSGTADSGTRTSFKIDTRLHIAQSLLLRALLSPGGADVGQILLSEK